ncbi:sigma-54-dependent Fis family transcriptional regulator [Anaeromicrobium sediminis]|uniref:AAA family ATPase n=1 Tax=Anaeromicrobium sediminis TaxID=1478221 RepID=A0A267MJ79_9FIRM|nr:sigma 54-interacting transcriptional regulator [Anaeromicrobium sediminis]PAB59651.1 AAA family ATPase [Anaeromicrobium sediminis]
MENVLRKMKDIIKKYSVVLSEVLKVDVEIVDSNLYRIAGTGKFSKEIDKYIYDSGYVTKKVIETSERILIENPGKDPVCRSCPNKESCEETFEVSTPIILNNQVIGAIGLVCFSKEQKIHIMENYNTFIRFLDQISDLISSKAYEVIENHNNMAILQLLNNITDKIDEGIVVFDKNLNLLKINSTGEKILNCKKSNMKNMSLEKLREEDNEIGEYNLTVNDKTYNLIGRDYNINIDNYNKIFIFNDANLLREKIFKLANRKEKTGLDRIIGNSKEIERVKKRVKMICDTSSTVLITGESGTGKELFARAIHEESKKNKEPFVPVNCGAIPENLLESELFGYVKGAFTGADPKGKIGKFQMAHGGTIFLDEIGDMPIPIQVKILRVLEEREVTPLGSNESKKINVRVIGATNKNLEKMVKENLFREDLYYRLNVIPLHIPPLRERAGDVRLLSKKFIDTYSKLFNKPILKVEEDFFENIEKYSWPGNVRELQNVMEYIVNIGESTCIIDKNILPNKIRNVSMDLELKNYNLEYIEKHIIKKAIEKYGNKGTDKKIVAEKLGIGIATLYRKMKKYNI